MVALTKLYKKKFFKKVKCPFNIKEIEIKNPNVKTSGDKNQLCYTCLKTYNNI